MVEKLVVIAASAGGIESLTVVLSHLPVDLAAAICVVQHLSPDRRTLLPEYLAHRCPLKVCLAQHGQLLERGAVYVAVPGKHLLIEHGCLALSIGEAVHHVRPSADVLFASAAQAFGHNVIGIVLSGTGRDGTQGCREIKACGGATIAQDEGTSRHFGMPREAITACAIDYVLPVTRIAEKIVEELSYAKGQDAKRC